MEEAQPPSSVLTVSSLVPAFALAYPQAKTRRYLPASFDIEQQWNRLPKDVATGTEALVSLPQFIAWADLVAAHSPPKPVPLVRDRGRMWVVGVPNGCGSWKPMARICRPRRWML